MESQESDSLYSVASTRSRTTDESSSLANYDDSSNTGSLHINSARSNGHNNGPSTVDDDEDGRNEEEEEGDDEEEITPAELIEKLQQCWLNEKFAPELLEHQTPVVECIIDQIKHMESNILTAKKGDFRIAIHKLELDRIKYMLCAYLRIRIKKIEQFAFYLLDEDSKRNRHSKSKLSPEEYAYATEYFKNVKSHLTSSVLDHLPINLQDLNEAVTMPKPQLNKFVFFKALHKINGILIDDMTMDGRNEIIDVDQGDLYVMRYKPIGNYASAGQIQLI